LTKKKKILFIINPISGIGRQKIVEKLLPTKLNHSLFDHEIAYTQYPHHAIELAKQASEQGFDIIVSVGGDGSANDVAQGLVNTQTAMGIIPVGSGNGLAHHLKIPTKISKAIEIINRAKIKRIDTGLMNDKLFISIAGVGYDALVAEKFSHGKKRGFWPYFQLVFFEFFKYKGHNYTIRFNGQSIQRKALLISFANSSQFGYNVTIAPDASINDGFLDLCIVHKMSVINAARIVHKLFMKDIDTSRHVDVYKVKEVIIQCEEPVSSQIDGDPSVRIKEVKVMIHPHSLNMIVP
jgi:YegS/Rv2252/BmrU family lipid kinase